MFAYKSSGCVFRRREIAERTCEHVSVDETHWRRIYYENVSIVP